MKVVFCIPGSNFSARFLLSWTRLMGYCSESGIEAVVSIGVNPNIYMARNKCLSGNIENGKNQKVFNGLDYDYIMWIDSDIIFEVQNFIDLLSHKKDIVCGYYSNSDGVHTTLIREYDFSKSLKLNFLSLPDVYKEKELFPVVLTGLGFSLVKHGVFEKFTYPWFKPKFVETDSSNVDITTEDISFCIDAAEKGYEILADPKIRVGHEKLCLL